MKQCKCEHWEQCPVCMPHRFDANGELLPIPLTPLQEAQETIAALMQDLQTTTDALGHANHDLMVRETVKDDKITEQAAEIEKLHRQCEDAILLNEPAYKEQAERIKALEDQIKDWKRWQPSVVRISELESKLAKADAVILQANAALLYYDFGNGVPQKAVLAIEAYQKGGE